MWICPTDGWDGGERHYRKGERIELPHRAGVEVGGEGISWE